MRSGTGPSPLPVLAHVLERTLRLLHPFMPFITEEIWQNLLARLPKETSTEGDIAKSIMVSPYPTANGDRQDDQAEAEISLVMQAIRAVRNARAQLHIPANQQLEALVERFVNTPQSERLQCRLASCPPHVRKNWQLGMARRQREEARKLSKDTVLASMPSIKFVFEDKNATWSRKTYAQMTGDDQQAARDAWNNAEEEEAAEAEASEDVETGSAISQTDGDRLCHLSEDAEIRSRMKQFMQSKLKCLLGCL